MNKRIDLIDSLRGFSLLGILLANLLIFQYGAVGSEFLTDLSTRDKVGSIFTKVFISTSFIPIFTFLFGYSLIKLFESLKQRQHKTRWPLIRRAIGLILLGLIHSLFIWEGDILFFYGLMLFFLLFFLYRKAKTLFIWVGILFVLSIPLTFGLDFELYGGEMLDAYLIEEKDTLQNGSYADILNFRQNAEIPLADEGSPDDGGFVVFILLLAPFMIAPMFLLGMACAKIRLFEKPDQERALYRKAAFMVIFGLVFKIIGVMDTSYSLMLYTIGGPLLAVGYIGLFALWYHSSSGQKMSSAFAAVGKLSLTNYLLQSIIFTLIFYGYGLGLFGKLGILLAMLVAILVYTGQIFVSQLYFRFFKRGPVETLLRIWTNWSLTGHTK